MQLAKKLTAFTVLAIILFSSITAYAHPGRTDSNGGHTCRTNCEKWGLQYGEYHYHNGGGSSGSGSRGNSSKSTTVQQSGPSPEEIAARDKSKGESEGYKTGFQDGYAGKERMPIATGSVPYVEGYELGYLKGYEEGKSKLDNEKQIANEEGYKLGRTSDVLIIPEQYKENLVVKQAFEEGFNKARKEVLEAKKKEYEQIGYEHGLNNMKEKPKDLEGELLEVYESAYEKGRKELKEKYVSLGYQAAFTMIEYQDPELEDAELVEWYKEGFYNNKEVEKIKDLAFEMGVNGEDYKLPEEYKNAEKVFKHYYDLGVKERKDNMAATTTVASLGIFGWLARRFYIARKMVK